MIQKTALTTSQLIGVLGQWKDDPIEHLTVALVDRAGDVTAVLHVASGDENSVPARWKEVFAAAWTDNAEGIVACHNHPNSAYCVPSQADIRLTQFLRKRGVELGIALIDHLIVCPTDHYYSFKEDGQL